MYKWYVCFSLYPETTKQKYRPVNQLQQTHHSELEAKSVGLKSQS